MALLWTAKVSPSIWASAGAYLPSAPASSKNFNVLSPALANEAFAHVMKTESGFVALDCDFVE